MNEDSEENMDDNTNKSEDNEYEIIDISNYDKTHTNGWKTILRNSKNYFSGFFWTAE